MGSACTAISHGAISPPRNAEPPTCRTQFITREHAFGALQPESGVYLIVEYLCSKNGVARGAVAPATYYILPGTCIS